MDTTIGASKFTIDPTILPLKINNPYGSTEDYYDHSLIGEHEFKLSVSYSLPFFVPGTPTTVNFKVNIESIC